MRLSSIGLALNIVTSGSGASSFIVVDVVAVDVTEESVVLGQVVANVTASSSEGAVTLTLIDATGYITLVGTEVQLTSSGVTAINNDSLDLTSISVQVQGDAGALTTTDTDIVTITRVNDNSPVITVTAVTSVDIYTVAVNDIVASFVASDADEDSLTYSILSDPNDWFDISGTDVIITAAGIAALEESTPVPVTVQVDDGINQSSDTDSFAVVDTSPNYVVTLNGTNQYIQFSDWTPTSSQQSIKLTVVI